MNDTRVAVFWDNRTLIFSLRPGKPETITLNGQKAAHSAGIDLDRRSSARRSCDQGLAQRGQPRSRFDLPPVPCRLTSLNRLTPEMNIAALIAVDL